MEVPLLRTGGRRSSSGYGSLATTPVLGAFSDLGTGRGGSDPPPLPPPLHAGDQHVYHLHHHHPRDRGASGVHFSVDTLLEESRRASREILGAPPAGTAPHSIQSSAPAAGAAQAAGAFASVDAFCSTLYRYWLYGGRGQSFERTISSGLRFSGLGVVLVLVAMVNPAIFSYRCATASSASAGGGGVGVPSCAVPFDSFVSGSRLLPPYSPYAAVLLVLAAASAACGAVLTAQAWMRQTSVEQMSLFYRDALGLYDGLLAVTPWPEVVKRVNAAVWLRATAEGSGAAAPSASAWMAAVDVLASRYKRVLSSRAQTLDNLLSEFSGVRGGGRGKAGTGSGGGLIAAAASPHAAGQASTILSALNAPDSNNVLLAGRRLSAGTSGAGGSAAPVAAPAPLPRSASVAGPPLLALGSSAGPVIAGTDTFLSPPAPAAASSASKTASPALSAGGSATGNGTPSYALLRPHMDVIPALALDEANGAPSASPTPSLTASPDSTLRAGEEEGAAGGGAAEGAVSTASTASLSGGSFPVAVISDMDELRLQLAGIDLPADGGSSQQANVTGAASGLGSSSSSNKTASGAGTSGLGAMITSAAQPLNPFPSTAVSARAGASSDKPSPVSAAPASAAVVAPFSPPPPLPLSRLSAAGATPITPEAAIKEKEVPGAGVASSPPQPPHPAPSRRASFGSPAASAPGTMLPLPAVQLAARLMRRDNYMVALVSSKTIDTTLKVPNVFAAIGECFEGGGGSEAGGAWRRRCCCCYVPGTRSRTSSVIAATLGSDAGRGSRRFSLLHDSEGGGGGASEAASDTSDTEGGGGSDTEEEDMNATAAAGRPASPASKLSGGYSRHRRRHSSTASGVNAEGSSGYVLPATAAAVPARSAARRWCCPRARRSCRCVLPWTRTIEWALWVTVIKPMLQRHARATAAAAAAAPDAAPGMATSVYVRQSFVGLEGPVALRRRFRVLGLLWLLALPLILPVALLLLLVRHSEQAYGATAAGTGARGDIWGDLRFSPWSRRAFGEYNELPHVLAARLREAVAPTTRVLAAAAGVTGSRAGPSKLSVALPILLTQLTFFTAALLVVALLLSVADADLMMNLHVVGGQNLTWTIGVLTAAVGGLRALSRTAQYQAREGPSESGAGANGKPGAFSGPFWDDVLAVAHALRYLKPSTTRRLEPLLGGGGAGTAPAAPSLTASIHPPPRAAVKLPPHLWASSVPEGVRRLVAEVQPLLHSRLLEYLLELGAVATTPLLLLFTLPKQADSIVNFVRSHTTNMPEVGPVCTASAMAAAVTAAAAAPAAPAAAAAFASARGRTGSALSSTPTASASPLLTSAGSGGQLHGDGHGTSSAASTGRPPVAPPLFAGGHLPSSASGGKLGSAGSHALGVAEGGAYHQLPVEGSMVLVQGHAAAPRGTAAPAAALGASKLYWKKMDQSAVSFAAHNADVAW